MNIRNLIIELLKTHKNKRITLLEIESSLPPNVEYESVGKTINNLIENGYIKVIISTGYNNKSVNLPNAFTIIKSKLRENFDKTIHVKSLSYNKRIDLDYYYKHDEKYWIQDEKYIDLINIYLGKNEFPLNPATVPERSYYISDDEKWLSDKGGLKVIERVNLTDDMNIIKEVDPIMFAISEKFMEKDIYRHLIVENKSIYYLLLTLLTDTGFSTLIYGAGWKIISSMKSFHSHFPFKDKGHEFYYFGDFDNEGIKIWSMLNEQFGVNLAKVFYEEIIKCKKSEGKETQLKNNDANEKFYKHMNYSQDEIRDIEEMLNNTLYIPQEALTKQQLETAWRTFDATQQRNDI